MMNDHTYTVAIPVKIGLVSRRRLYPKCHRDFVVAQNTYRVNVICKKMFGETR